MVKTRDESAARSEGEREDPDEKNYGANIFDSIDRNYDARGSTI